MTLLCFDYSWDNDQAYKTGIYAESKAKLVAWRMHYHTYYKESLMFCDWNWAKPNGMGDKGTPFGEPRLYNAVTGKKQTFLEGMEIGRKAWNLKRAIYALQGRHKENEKFAGYMYKPGASGASFTNTLPVYDGKKWSFENVGKMYLSEKRCGSLEDSFITSWKDGIPILDIRHKGLLKSSE